MLIQYYLYSAYKDDTLKILSSYSNRRAISEYEENYYKIGTFQPEDLLRLTTYLTDIEVEYEVYEQGYFQIKGRDNFLIYGFWDGLVNRFGHKFVVSIIEEYKEKTYWLVPLKDSYINNVSKHNITWSGIS